MALVPLQSSYFISTTKLTPHNLCKSLTNFPTKTKLIVTSQDTSSSSKPTIEQPSSSSGQGFGSGSGSVSGSGSGSGAAGTSSKGGKQETGKKKKGKKKERATIIRRSPVGTPVFTTDSKNKKDGDNELNSNVKDQSQNESAFLLAWLALGSLILVQGIALAASGFLPQEWDKYFVKYLYPSFTPTVFLFVAGTVVYGVFKYFQNESLRDPK